MDDEFVMKLIEERFKKEDVMVSGWVLVGFPKSSKQIEFLQKFKIKPSLVVNLHLN